MHSMLWVEWRIFVRNRRFVLLSMAPLLVGLLSAFSQYAAARIGLLYTTGYAFIVRTLNLYAVLLLPFLNVGMAVYLLMAEFHWRTIRRPFIEHRSRTAFLCTKAFMAGVILIFLMFPYALLTLLLAWGLFGLQPVLLEDITLNVGQSLLRALLAYIWVGLILYLMALLGQLLALRTRNLLLAVLGSLMVFYGLVLFGHRLPLGPLRTLVTLSQRMVEARALAPLIPAILQGLSTWAILTGMLLGLHLHLFQHQDITVD